MTNFLKKTKKGALGAAAIAGFIMQSGAAYAGEVTLKSADGTVNIVGELIEFVDDNYLIGTPLGELRISASRVRCEGASCPTFDVSHSDLHFFGSETVGLGIMPLLLTGYAAFNDAEIAIENTQTADEFLAGFIGDNGYGEKTGEFLVSATTTGHAFDGMIEGEDSIGMASRRINPTEARALRAAGKGNMVSVEQEHIIAVDSMVIIVNPENGIDTISTANLRDIFSGAVTNWNQIGGKNMPIQVVTHGEDSGASDVFNRIVFGKSAPATPSGAIVGHDSNEISALVNEGAGAIGYVGHAFTRGAKSLNLINDCGIASTPDPFSVKTEEYDLGYRLYLYNDNQPSDKARDFLKFAVSPDADGVIAKSGFISLHVSKRKQSMDSHRAEALLTAQVDAFEGAVIREMLASMVKSDRLSSTFRFRTGSSRLDERGLMEMARLVSFLERQPEGTNITMVGFTDNVGAFGANRGLSINRAQQVVDLVRVTAGSKVSHINFTVAGFGEVSPSGCNTSEIGRGINRRVEVWIGK